MNTVPSRANKAVRQWQNKIFLTLFCRRALPLTGWAAFLAGGIILLSRVLWPDRTALLELPVLALPCLLPAWVAAALLAWRRVPAARDLLVWLDYCDDCGGLLTAALEVDTRLWNTPERTFPLPHQALLWHRQLPVMLAGLAFLLLAALLPEKHYRHPPQFSLDISSESAVLNRKLQVLSEESLLPAAERQKIQHQLQELQVHNDARDAAGTYGVLQAIEQSLSACADAAAAASLQQSGAQAALATMLDRLNALPEDTPRLPAATEQLSELLRQYSDSTAGDGWPGEDFSALETRDWPRLAEQLRQCSNRCRQKLDRMVQADLAKQFQAQAQSAAQNGEPELADWLAQNAPAADALLELCCPGNGDSNYGRADAPLNFSGQAAEGPWQFQDQALSASGAPADSIVLQRRTAAPPPGSALATEEPSAATAVQPGESESHQVRIFPEHRAAVRRYFSPAGGGQR